MKFFLVLLATLAAHASEFLLQVDRGHYWTGWPTNSELVLEDRPLHLQWNWPETVQSNGVHFRLYMKPTPPTNSAPLPPMPPGYATPPAPRVSDFVLDGSEILWQTFIRTNGYYTFDGMVDAALPWGTNALRLTAYVPWMDYETAPSNTLIVRVLKNTSAPVGGPALRIGRWEEFLGLEFGTNSLAYAERIEFAPQNTAAKTYLLVSPSGPETSGFWFTTSLDLYAQDLLKRMAGRTPPLTQPAD